VLPVVTINEIYPNPENGSEWIELKINAETETTISLSNYTLCDSYHQIYKFEDEQFSNQLLVVEVSGLNNDQDSVILKDENAHILDSFTYTQTQKGLSFARDPENNTFVLAAASRNQPNPQQIPTTSISPTVPPINLTNSPSLTPTPTPTITSSPPSPSTSPLPTPSLVVIPTLEALEPTPIVNKEKNSTIETTFLPEASINYSYDLNQINLNINQQDLAKRPTRLVILGKNFKQTAIFNAIIGSSLMILSSLLLIYVKIKNKGV